ncbi:MAG: hypothetical protein ACK5NN_13365, partial [Sphingomonadaceae bacterium]
MTAILLAMTAFVPGQASAQAQRSMVNESFEANNPQGTGLPNWQIFPATSVPGWESTDPNGIELWDSGFLGVTSAAGQVHAEMNAYVNASIYQNVCLISGESFNWRFAHRARAGQPVTLQTARFEIANSSGAVLQSIFTSQTSDTTAWSYRNGVATYTGASGLQRIQFTTPDPGSGGNFLDAIQISLKPFVEFSPAATSSVEGASTPTMPGLIINGTFTSATAITVNITGGSATLGSDYTTPSGTSTFTVTIPAGVYDQQVFPLGINIINDTVLEGSETIDFSITPDTTKYLIASTSSCGATPRLTATHTINDKVADLVTVKTLASGNATPLEGDIVRFLITVRNNGSSQATGVTLTDLLPTGMTATAGNGTVSQGSYNAGSGLWSIGTLANGATATLSLEGTADPGTYGSTITNTTTAASGVEPDGSTTGDDLSESVEVVGTPGLSIAKAMTNNADEDGSGSITLNDTLSYSVTATNSGTVTQHNVVVSDNKITPNTITCATLAP